MITGLVLAPMSGTPSTQEGSAPPASISGLQLGASRVPDGRCIRSDTPRSDSEGCERKKLFATAINSHLHEAVMHGTATLQTAVQCIETTSWGKPMADAVVEALIFELLQWLAKRERSYEEVMDAWRTSCPRLPVWEEANDRGLIMREDVNGRCIVRITSSGLALLEQHKTPPRVPQLPHNSR